MKVSRRQGVGYMRSGTLLGVTLVLLSLLGSVGEVQARGTADIGATIHNFSTSGTDPLGLPGPSPYADANEDRICVFCHTPHGGSLDAPLWNRDVTGTGQDAASAYQHYYNVNASSAVTADPTRKVNDASVICLSCHDGSFGPGQNLINHNGPALTNTAPIEPDYFGGTPGRVIGASSANLASTNDLRDDHPISIDMATSFAEKGSEFNDPSGVTAATGMRLFTQGGAYMVECSTCHDPHVDYISQPQYEPFLAMSNANSDMCLACHIK